MQEPPSPETEIPETPASVAAGSPTRFRVERRVLGSLFFVWLAVVVVHGAWVIHREVFRPPRVPPPSARCDDGIRLMQRAYAGAFAPPSADAPSVGRALRSTDALDEQLRALSIPCEQEGAEAEAAHHALTVWRYRLQSLARSEAAALDPDVQRALEYRSPAAHPAPAAPEPTVP